MIGIKWDRLSRVCLQICLVAGFLMFWAGPGQAVAFNADPHWAADRADNRALALERAHARAHRKIWLAGANPPGPHRPVIITGTLGDAARIGGIAITPASPTWKMQGLKPRLVALLAKVQERFGRSLHIVSGCRSKAHNTKVRGAKRSQHLECSAIDFEIDGVTKHQLVDYLKQMPGRGGVGLYCRSSYVHLDIGPKREWHWHCKKPKVAKKRKIRRKKHASVKRTSSKKAKVKQKVIVQQASASVKKARVKKAKVRKVSYRLTGAKGEVVQRKAFKQSSTKRKRLVVKNDR